MQPIIDPYDDKMHNAFVGGKRRKRKTNKNAINLEYFIGLEITLASNECTKKVTNTRTKSSICTTRALFSLTSHI